VPARATSPLVESLYQELLTIGRTERSIRWDHLTEYDHLLSCAEVRRRAGLHPGKDRLAQCAADVLKDAIASIVSPLTREVAEAALCVTKRFEGRQVKERVAKLDITAKQFKYRRGLAFDTIIEFLMRDTPSSAADAEPTPSASATPKLVPLGNATCLEHLQILARKAAALHYACLGVLFAYDFDDELTAHGVEPFERLVGGMPRTTLADYMFYAYIAFVYDHWSLARLRTPAMGEHLSGDVVQQLFLLWQQVADGSPAGPNGITDDQRTALELGSSHLDDIRDHPTARKVYYKTWYGWCKGRGFAWDEKYPAPAIIPAPGITRTRDHLFDAVTPIAAASGAFLAVIGQHVQLGFPVHSEKRVMTHKALASCYGFDEWVPLVDGKPLRYRAETYFDVEGPALTQQALL
jgi:hypothetical protein